MRSLANLFVEVGKVLVNGLQSRPGGCSIVLRGLLQCQLYPRPFVLGALTGLLGAILSPRNPFVGVKKW
jgi:hypothetical protein